MTNSVYIASPEGLVGKSAIALGLIESLTRTVGSVGVFRPLVRSATDDHVTKALIGQPAVDQQMDTAVGVTYDEVANDPDEALATIVSKFGALDGKYDAIVVLGSDYTGVSAPTEMSFNARVAANLNTPVLLVVRGKDKSAKDVLRSAQLAIHEFRAQHNQVVGVIATRCQEDQLVKIRAELDTLDDAFVAALPENKVLAAPTVRQQFDRLGANFWMGDKKNLDRESLSVLVAGMSLPNLLDRLEPEASLVVPSDRLDLLPGLLLAHTSDTFPNLAALFLVGGYEVPKSIKRLLEGLRQELPIGTTPAGTFTTAERLFGIEGHMTSSPRKIEVARRLFNEHVDDEALLQAIDVTHSDIRTPLMFQYQLMQQARTDRRTIVLPEASDDRILESASIILHRGVAKVILLGDEREIRSRAADLGFDVEEAQIVSPTNKMLVEKFAAEYVKQRSHKGITLEQAREKMADLSYFATMMVHFSMADGMVSGAVNTTANTIRPSLEFIKTKKGVNVVNSSFLMCMPDRVLVYADCAVNPDPTAEQLADIAVSSVETARAFDIVPKVAMLSYSTGESGTGADVDKVRAATEMLKEREPDLPIEGPIQFDAAVDPTVGKKKMPGSTVAGEATVFIFPDLNTGNNTYKAVQRTSGAVAIGPVMQGLNRPVNDLSRGALVDDIVNTVAITAIQAQSLPKATTKLR